MINLTDILNNSINNLSQSFFSIKYYKNFVVSYQNYTHSIILWDVFSGNPIFIFSSDETIFIFSFSLDCTKLICGSSLGKIKQWDIQNGNLLNDLSAHDNTIYCLEYLPNNTFLSAGTDRIVKLWDNDCNLLKEFYNDFPICFLSSSSNGKKFGISGWNNLLRVWDIENDTYIDLMSNNHFIKISFSPEADYIASKHYYNKIKIWKLDTGKTICKYERNSYGDFIWKNYSIDIKTKFYIYKALETLPDDVILKIINILESKYDLLLDNQILFSEK